MEGSAVVLGVAGAYLAACLAIGLWPRRTSASAAGFVAGDRSIGPLVMYFLTGATIFSAFAFLGAPGWAYSRGAAAFYILGFGTIGFVPFYFLGPRAARLGARYGFVTQAQMVSQRFGSRAIALVMALVATLAFIPYLTLQMRGCGEVLFVVTGGALPQWVGAAIVYGIVLAYVLKSGVLGVGWTNTFQGIFMMALAWGMGLWLPWQLHGGVGAMFRGLAADEGTRAMLTAPGLADGGAPWSWSEYTSLMLVSAIGFSFWPHLFMKAFTARDEGTLRRTVVLYPTFQIFLVPILIIGFAGIGYTPAPERADQIVPHLLMQLDVPAVVVGLFCAGALAASMSSGDAILHASASILVRDGWVSGLGRPLEPAAERRAIRVVIVAVLLAAYAVALSYGADLVRLLAYAYGPITQLAPAVVATMYWRRASAPGVLAGLVSGILAGSLFAAWPELRPFAVHEGVYGLVANVLALVTVSLALPREHAGEAEYLAVAARREQEAAGAAAREARPAARAAR